MRFIRNIRWQSVRYQQSAALIQDTSRSRSIGSSGSVPKNALGSGDLKGPLLPPSLRTVTVSQPQKRSHFGLKTRKNALFFACFYTFCPLAEGQNRPKRGLLRRQIEPQKILLQNRRGIRLQMEGKCLLKSRHNFHSYTTARDERPRLKPEQWSENREQRTVVSCAGAKAPLCFGCVFGTTKVMP
jgi:hypothetical protein